MSSSDKKIEWQQPIASISETRWDVVTIGAGPAGAMAAYHLAAAGLKVLLLDKEHFPREKVCGDALLPDALRCLERAGIGDIVREHGHHIRTASLFSPSEIKFDVPADYLTLRRSILDTIVAQHAVEAGAVFARGKVENLVVQTDDSVSFAIRGREGEHKARIALVATGANIGLLKKTRRFQTPRPNAVAMRCYVRSSFELDNMLFAVDKKVAPGYTWIFPMVNHEYNIGCGFVLDYVGKSRVNMKKMYHDFVKEFPVARELIQKASMIQPLRGAPIRSDFRGAYPLSRGPVILVGETLGATLPTLLEGIGKAMETGEMAAEIVRAALVSNDLSLLRDYSERLSQKLKPLFKRYRTAGDWMKRPWLTDFVFSRVQKSKYLTEAAAGIIDETHTPGDIFSVKGLIRSFYK
jgi:geranylgeranyl reductase family protein